LCIRTAKQVWAGDEKSSNHGKYHGSATGRVTRQNRVRERGREFSIVAVVKCLALRYGQGPSCAPRRKQHWTYGTGTTPAPQDAEDINEDTARKMELQQPRRRVCPSLLQPDTFRPKSTITPRPHALRVVTPCRGSSALIAFGLLRSPPHQRGSAHDSRTHSTRGMRANRPAMDILIENCVAETSSRHYTSA